MTRKNVTERSKAPEFVSNGGFIPTNEYNKWLKELKQRVRQLQTKAAVRINAEMLELYWSLGRDITKLKAEQIWGDGFFPRLSLDLRDEFPSIRGFSESNLRYIHRWYVFYNQPVGGGSEIPHQLGEEFQMPEKFALVPWRHHIEIFTKSKGKEEALFYIDRVVEENWSRIVLERQIKSDLYGRHGSALTNFNDKLGQPQGGLAEEVLKDPYKLDFLNMRPEYDERQLEDALARNISRFLLELGSGFAFVGRQMELKMPDGKSYFPDMIFYHTKLKCYIVLELKVVDFMPEFAGKLNFYVSAADELLRDSTDNPSIGLLICKDKDDTTVRWAFRGVTTPMGVATYELQEVLDDALAGKLPSIKEIEEAIDGGIEEM